MRSQTQTKPTVKKTRRQLKFTSPTTTTKAEEALILSQKLRRDLEATLIQRSNLLLRNDFEPLPLSYADLIIKAEREACLQLPSMLRFQVSAPAAALTQSPAMGMTRRLLQQRLLNQNVLPGDFVASQMFEYSNRMANMALNHRNNMVTMNKTQAKMNETSSVTVEPENNTEADTQHDGFKLPKGFELKPDSVIIGRGNDVKQSLGNRRLRALAESKLPEYANARRKKEKSVVVTDIFNEIKSLCPVGGFVKLVNKEWWQASDAVAKEKIGYVLRDLLSSKYSSSSASKTAKRRMRIEELKAKQASMISAFEGSNDMMII